MNPRIPIVLTLLICSIAGAQRGDTFATVNGAKILKTDLRPDIPTALAVQWAIDTKLAAEQAVNDGLERKPAFLERQKKIREQVSARASRNSTWLARLRTQAYITRAPELAAVKDKTFDDAKIAAYIAEHPEQFERVKATRRSATAASHMRSALYESAYREWMAERLSGMRVKVNGKKISRSLIDEAITAMVDADFGRPSDKGDILLIKVKELAGRNLAAAVVEAGDEKIILGELFGFGQIRDGNSPQPAWLTRAVTNRVMGTQASKAGVDDDPQVAAELAATAEASAPATSSILAGMYFEAHNLAPGSAQATAAELQSVANAMAGVFLGEDGSAVRNSLSSVKRTYVDADVTDAELEYWRSVIASSILGDHDGIQNALHASKLHWMRQAHLAALRSKAKVELFLN